MLPSAPQLPGRRLQGTGQGIGMASQSPVRVSVTPPQRKERDRLTGTARRDVVLKCIGLGENSPYVEGMLSNTADYRGPVTPYPATPDNDWNKELSDALEASMFSRQDWDASGNFSFFAMQRMMWRYFDLEGDLFMVDTFEEAGNENSRPVSRLIPSLMCDSPQAGMGYHSEWVDGVKVGLHHRALRYHFLAEETAMNTLGVGYRDGFEVPREHVFHFGLRRNIGGTRGVTRFLTSGNVVVDAAMMDSALHRMFDLAAKLNGSLTQEKDGTPVPKKTVGAGIFETTSTPTEATESPENAEDPDDPQPFEIDQVREGLNTPGAVLVDLTETPGAKLNFQTLRDHLPDVASVHGAALERMVMPWGLPVQVALCIFSGMFNVTGPGFRISLARGSRWRTEELRRITPWAVRAYHREVAWLIETGQVARPKKSMLNPLLCRTRTEPDLTIDEQRDVNNDIKRLEMGVTSEQELAHLYGRTLPDVVRERAEAINMICDALGERVKYWGKNYKEQGGEEKEDRPRE